MNTKTKHLLWLLLSFVLFGSLIWASPAFAQTPVQPNYDTATVDGNYSEWNLDLDYFADMYRAGIATKEVEAKLYLRYDTLNDVMYVLVLSENGQNIEKTPLDNAYVTLNGVKQLDASTNNDGIAPDFAWINPNSDRAAGWEASFPFAINPETVVEYSINVHTNVYADGESQTAAVAGRSIPFTPSLYDYGDLPASRFEFVSELRHYAGPMRLGVTVDGESHQQDEYPLPEGDDCDGDNGDDEDGVTYPYIWGLEGPPQIEVVVYGCSEAVPCYLNGWVDWDHNFVFDGDGITPGADYVIQDMKITSNGLMTIDLTPPAPNFDLQTFFYLRFRICEAVDTCDLHGTVLPGSGTEGILSQPAGEARGELEDYAWNFAPTPVRLQSFSASTVPGVEMVYLGGVVLAILMILVLLGRRLNRRPG
ncbi:MAG: hypothetical protein JW862_02275 [Anaerolineales bacterium]|nr:hypothetical protein [Anaerolineales bacterium]